MTNTLTISRDLAERLDSPHSSVRNAALESLRALLEKSDDADKVNNRQMGLMQFVDKHAAPVVERQEPIYQSQYLGDGGGGFCDVERDVYERDSQRPNYRTRIVYTSPPAPVAVVLPERLPEPNWDDFKPMSQEYEAACEGVSKWNGCIDKVKEMNE